MQLLAHLYAPRDCKEQDGSGAPIPAAAPAAAAGKVVATKKEEEEEEEEACWEEEQGPEDSALMCSGGGGGGSGGGGSGGGSGSADEDDLVALVPRLWLFLRHSLASVRLSTAQCLERLLAALRGNPFGASWLPPLLPALMLLTFQVTEGVCACACCRHSCCSHSR